MAEIALGKPRGYEGATNPDVKQLRSACIDDHSKANDEPKAYASQKGVTLPADLDAGAQGH